MSPTLELLSGLIFALTLVAIVIRPRRLDEGLAAIVGAALMVLVGVVSPARALVTLAAEWNVFLFFLGLMLIAAVADLAGFFDWAGALAAATAGGSARRLMVSVFIVGALITTFLSNDATALILTPVVYSIVTRLRLPVVGRQKAIRAHAALAYAWWSPPRIGRLTTVALEVGGHGKGVFRWSGR